jgi:Mg-chelatase subunit ChlD
MLGHKQFIITEFLIKNMNKILTLIKETNSSKRALVFASAVFFVSVFIFNLNVAKVNGCVQDDPGSITVCKIIIDEEGNIITDASDYSPASFNIPLSGESASFSDHIFEAQDFSPNTKLINNYDDAECVTYDNLELGNYYYGEEIISPEENWEEPLYNDQFSHQVNSLGDFFVYDGDLNDESRNKNSDGHIVLSQGRPERTLVILNQYKVQEPSLVTIHALKVVCEGEEYLPDWARTSSNPSMITEDLVNQYVDDSDGKCWFEPGWEFEWGETSAPEKNGDYIGYGGQGWNTFGPTDNEGKVIVEIDYVEGRQYFWMREVLQEGYIPFSDSGDGSESVSAEMLCHIDAYKYDNYDRVDNPEAGETYYCVAFNAPMPTYSISGKKWEDLNGNGEENCGENGLEGWEITLSNGEEVIATTTTDSNGYYIFEDLLPGAYEVCEVLVDGWENTYPGEGNLCHSVEIEESDITDINFGNNLIEEEESLFIYARKVVCEEEQYLPNWGADSNNPPQITGETAEDYVLNSNGMCHFEAWDFQWGIPEGAVKKPGEFIGFAPEPGWNVFGPHDEDLRSIAEISGTELGENTIIWVREVLRPDFVIFTDGYTSEDDYSAEMYCHIDAYKYDNYDRVDNPEMGDEYHCVAFNAPTCTINSNNWNQVDRINLGDSESMDDHDAQEWWDDPGVGNYGGRDGGNLIAIVRGGDECSEETAAASFTLQAGASASSLVLRHLDGLSNLDSFDVYINGIKIGRYLDSQDSEEIWITTHFSLPEGMSGQLEVEIVNINNPWVNCSTYGQLAFNWAEVGYCGETPPAKSTLYIIKDVVGGTAVSGDFTIYVVGNNPSIMSFPGEEFPGTIVTLDHGPYSVSESTSSDYISMLSADCSGTIAEGEVKTCTITNSFDEPPYCGDGICNGDEYCYNCPEDCGSCGGPGPDPDPDPDPEPEPEPYCGDGIVNGDEECDGEEGVPEGYVCNEHCVLERTICEMDLNVMIVIDVSGSMANDIPTKLSQVQINANNFIGNLRNNDKSGVVSFSGIATLEKGLSTDHASTQSVIDGLVAFGATNIGDAIYTANQELISEDDISDAARIEILLTDGKANRPNGDGINENSADLALALERSLEAADNGITIFTIGVGNEVNEVMLQTIADNTGGTYYFIPTAGELEDIFNQISSEACLIDDEIEEELSVKVFDSRIMSVSDNSVTVSWLTNIPATSRVIYDTVPHPVLGDAPNYGYEWSTEEYSTKTYFHVVTIAGIDPGETYYWRPVSHGSGEKVGEETSFSIKSLEDNMNENNQNNQGEQEEREEEKQEEMVENEEGQSRAENIVEEEEKGEMAGLIAAIGEFFRVENPCLVATILLSILAIIYVFTRMRKGKRTTGKNKYSDLIAGMIILAILAIIFKCALLLIPVIILAIPLLKDKFLKQEKEQTQM